VAVVTGDIVVLSAYRMQDMAALGAAQRVRITWKGTVSEKFHIRYVPMDLSEYEILNEADFMLWHRARLGYGFLALESYVEMATAAFRPETWEQMRAKRPRADGKIPVIPLPGNIPNSPKVARKPPH